MIDDCKILLDIHNPPYESLKRDSSPFNFNGLNFLPKYSKDGMCKGYFTQLKNLRIGLYGHKMTIENSFHKYYKGNNYSDYHLSEIRNTVDQLNTILGMDISSAEIKKLSYSLNIKTESPDRIISGLNSFKTTPFEPMRWNHKVYGATVVKAQYKIKAYNKTSETKLHYRELLDTKIFRFEVEVKNMRHLHNRKHPINIYKLSDLYKPENMRLLCEDLMDKYRTIIKHPSINLDPHVAQDLYKLAIFNKNKEILKALKKNHNRTYKRCLKRYKELIYEYEKEDLYNEVERKLIEKYELLLAG